MESRGPPGTSLVVLWFAIHLPMQGTQVRSLVGELRFHMPQGNGARMTHLEKLGCCKEDPVQPKLKIKLKTR